MFNNQSWSHSCSTTAETTAALLSNYFIQGNCCRTQIADVFRTKGQMSTPGCGDRSRLCAQTGVSCVPTKPLTNGFWFVFVFVFFRLKLHPRRPKFPRKLGGRGDPCHRYAWQGFIEHVRLISGSISKNQTAWTSNVHNFGAICLNQPVVRKSYCCSFLPAISPGGHDTT